MPEHPAFEDILYELRGRAAWIMINRPKVYNAFRGRTVEELIQAFQLAANDKNVACVVLTGAGEKAFCTGGTNRHMKATTMVAASLACRSTSCKASFATSRNQ